MPLSSLRRRSTRAGWSKLDEKAAVAVEVSDLASALSYCSTKALARTAGAQHSDYVALTFDCISARHHRVVVLELNEAAIHGAARQNFAGFTFTSVTVPSEDTGHGRSALFRIWPSSIEKSAKTETPRPCSSLKSPGVSPPSARRVQRLRVGVLA